MTSESKSAGRLLAAWVGHPCRSIASAWDISFGHGGYLSIGCPWRVVIGGSIEFASEDPRLETDSERLAEARTLLLRKRIVSVAVTPGIGDLKITFENDTLLEVFTSSASLEGWWATSFSDESYNQIIGMGGGRLEVIEVSLAESGRIAREAIEAARQAKVRPPDAVPTTTAEATIAALLAHGLNTLYALPGVHNDHLFDALFKAGDRIRVIHTRHEQGAAYMALGAALATGKPQAYAVVPGPGLLNTSAALLTAYSMNAPVLALIGHIPREDIGRGFGHLHEIRDQEGILARLVDFSTRIAEPADAERLVGKAFRAMATDRRGPAALACPIDTWGKIDDLAPVGQLLPTPPTDIDEDAILAAAKRLGAAKSSHDRCRWRRAGCLGRSDRPFRHAAVPGLIRFSARTRGPGQPQPFQCHAAAGA